MCLGAVVLLLTRTFVVQVFIMLRDSEDSSRLRIQTLQPRLEEEVQDTEAYPKQSFLICILSEGSLSVRCRQRRRGASTDGRRALRQPRRRPAPATTDLRTRCSEPVHQLSYLTLKPVYVWTHVCYVYVCVRMSICMYVCMYV